MQLAQPRRIEHRTRAPDPTNPKYVGRIGTDGARRAIRQLNHQQQHAVPPLKRPRRQQTPEQRMGLRDNPHIARQHRTQLLQSVAFTPGTGKTHLAVGLARAAAHQPVSRTPELSDSVRFNAGAGMDCGDSGTAGIGPSAPRPQASRPLGLFRSGEPSPLNFGSSPLYAGAAEMGTPMPCIEPADQLLDE